MTNQTDLIREVRAALEAYKVGATGSTTNIFMNTPTWLQQLTDRLEEAVKALEWYGDPDKHEIKRRLLGDYAPITLDKGETAQKALKLIKGENG